MPAEPIFFRSYPWVGLLQNPEDKFYVGQTNDVPARRANHTRTDQVGGKFTRNNGPWTFVWPELPPTRSAANGTRAPNRPHEIFQGMRENPLNAESGPSGLTERMPVPLDLRPAGSPMGCYLPGTYFRLSPR